MRIIYLFEFLIRFHYRILSNEWMTGFLGVPPTKRSGSGYPLLSICFARWIPLLSLTRGIPLKIRHKDSRNGLLRERKLKYRGINLEKKFSNALDIVLDVRLGKVNVRLTLRFRDSRLSSAQGDWSRGQAERSRSLHSQVRNEST